MSVGGGWFRQGLCERLGGMAGRAPRLEEMGETLKTLAHCALALKEDLQAEFACECAKAFKDQGSSQGVPDGASHYSELPFSPRQLQAVSSAPAEATHLNGSRDQDLPILDAILKNQEALRKILMNQDTLKSLVDRLLEAVTNIEGRVHAIEREMGLLSRFTEELDAVEAETNWG